MPRGTSFIRVNFNLRRSRGLRKESRDAVSLHFGELGEDGGLTRARGRRVRDFCLAFRPVQTGQRRMGTQGRIFPVVLEPEWRKTAMVLGREIFVFPGGVYVASQENCAYRRLEHGIVGSSMAETDIVLKIQQLYLRRQMMRGCIGAILYPGSVRGIICAV